MATRFCIVIQIFLFALALLILSSSHSFAAEEKAPKLILAHRMLGFGPHFSPDGKEPYGFLFPVKDPKKENVTGWCREGHIGALHPKFASKVEEFKWEIQQAQAGGVDGFVLDTCGGVHEFGVPTDMIKASEELGGTFKIGLCLDYGWGGNELKVASVKEWMKRFSKSPAILRMKNLPAFVTYGTGYSTPDKVETMFSELRTAAGEPIYLCLDLSEFPNKKTEDWDITIRNYAKHAEGISCFYSRQPLERNAQAFAAISKVYKELKKDWSLCPWPNYYTPGRTTSLENIGADNSIYWDAMWKMARDTDPAFVQLTTWNDITEDTTVMPGVRRHFAFTDLMGNYYSPWYKTGTEPKPLRDQVYTFYRPYRTDAASPLIAGPRVRGSKSQDNIEVRSFLTAPGIVKIDGIGEKEVPAGMSSVTFDSKPGKVVVTLLRNKKTILTFTAPELITDKPWRQDFSIRGFSSEEDANWKKWFPGQPVKYFSEYGDDDKNGLPNWFERYYFGQWTGTDQQADPDKDGQTNLQEYQAGTDPCNAPLVYPVDTTWNAGADFRVKDETYPIPDALGSKIWEFEFTPTQGELTGKFQSAGLLVQQIPAWLERGNSWAFGIGKPEKETLAYFGEKDSSSSQVWTSPLTGKIKIDIELSKSEHLTPVTVTLTQEGEKTPLWTNNFDVKGEPVSFSKELTVKTGDRLRLAIAGKAENQRWSTRVKWIVTFKGDK
jgi:hypothetical protein